MEISEYTGFWAYGDEDLGIQTPGFIVKDVLEDRTRTCDLELPGTRLKVVVPNPEALVLIKMCALHNRDLCYRSYHDGVAMMQIGHPRVPQLWTQSQSYYHRKASKDLYDCGELIRMKNIRRPFMDLIEPLRLRDVVKSIPDSIDRAVRHGANDLAIYVDSTDPFEGLVAFLSSID